MHLKTLALLFAVVYLVVVTVTSANPIDIDENDLPICPEGCECNFLRSEFVLIHLEFSESLIKSNINLVTTTTGVV